MPITTIGQRRSERLLLDIPLVVRGRSGSSQFREETFSLVASAHGALVMLEQRVTLGEKVVLMNPQNWDECEGTVAYVGPPYAGLARVGIEFCRPSPAFWGVSSPPPSWKVF
jgi:hypothetical protein